MDLQDPAQPTTADDGTVNSEVNVDPAAAAAPTTDPASPLPGTVAPVAAAGAPSPYTPDFKYKVAGQEKELDPFYRSLIKDADSEKRVKDLFTQVDAFDFMKGRKEHYEKQFESLMGDYQQVGGTVQKFNEAVQRDDLSSAFRLGNIPTQKVFEWCKQQLQIMEMPPEQRAAYERQQQVQQQNQTLEEQVHSLRSQYEEQAVQARTMQLDMALNRPDISRYVQAWDNANQTPGAFRNFVAEEARRIWHESRAAGKPRDVSPEEAIQSVIQRFGRFLNVGDTAGQPSQAVQQPSNRQAPPVIPTIAGQAASPIKKVPKNLDDIRKLAKEMQ